MWAKLISLLESIGRDKLYHFIAGLIIAACFALPLGMRPCIIPVLFAAFIKEFIDRWNYGCFDWHDIMATAAGGAVIQILILL